MMSSSDDEQADDEHRSNRFQGPSSTWRTYTEDERALAASLDQAQANDLSIHLYNAHALKARLYDPGLAARAKPCQAKKRWIRPDEGGKLPWRPDARWTAWPVSKEDVPRRGEVFGRGVDGVEPQTDPVRELEGWRPGAELEEEIEAVVLRRAKERFRRRSWVLEAPRTEVPQFELPHRSSKGLGEGCRSGSAKAARAGNAFDGTGTVDAETEKATLGDTGPQTSNAPPEFLADEEQASKLLQPSVRHIVAQLDNLLLGLHKSRRGQHRRNAQSASRSRSASRSASRPRKRKRKRVVSAAATADSPSSNSDHSVSERGEADRARAAEAKLRKTKEYSLRLAPRDWSEVLGIASLTSWDQAVVDRTARRCAALFGEGMAMRAMPETAAHALRDEVVQYVPDMAPSSLHSASDESEDSFMQAVSTPRYICPHKTCRFHARPFGKGYRWREHLKRVHGYSREEAGELEQDLGIGSEAAVDSSASADAGEGVESGGLRHVEGDEEMVGGVRNDGFLRPIAVRLGRGADARPRRRRGKDTRTQEGGKRAQTKVGEE